MHGWPGCFILYWVLSILYCRSSRRWEVHSALTRHIVIAPSDPVVLLVLLVRIIRHRSGAIDPSFTEAAMLGALGKATELGLVHMDQ